jgi:Uma2 family endonuclease
MIKKGRSILAQAASKRMTLGEFLSWDDGTDTRYELWDGVVVAMAPPMAPHGRLALALGGELRAALRSRPPCGAFSEAGIALPDRNDTFYVADIAVTCQPLRAEDRLSSNPVLIVEVLSPSTAADRQIKNDRLAGLGTSAKGRRPKAIHPHTWSHVLSP